MSHAHRVDVPGSFHLSKVPTDSDGGLDKEEGQKRAEALGRELDELEDLLYYAGTHALLVVLQGMDTAGKDGMIRFLLGQVNGQSCRVESFKVPTPVELAHDFLWRVHAKTPARGEMTLFNRSHYEDVGVVRVHNLVPKPVWRARYGQIREFEALLASQNTIVLKFFLHISKQEQEERLMAREREVEKAWKLSVGDWKERAFWDDYQDAYSDAIGKCAAKHAPWFVVPADRKWYRNLAVAEAIVEALRPYREAWLNDLKKVGDAALAELAEYRRQLEPS